MKAFWRTPLLVGLLLSTCVLAKPPEYGEAFLKAYRTGYEKLQAKEYEAALNDFREAVRAAGPNREAGPAHARVGECLQALRRWPEAAASYEKAMALTIPGSDENNLRRQRHIAESIEQLSFLYSAKLKQFDKAEAVLQKMTRYNGVHPHDCARALAKLASQCARQKEHARALRIIRQAQEQDGLNPDWESMLLLDQAKIHTAAGDFEDALNACDRAMAVEGIPAHRQINAMKYRGELLARRLKKPKEAIETYSRIVSMPEANRNHLADAAKSIADIHAKERDYDRAVAVIEQAETIEKLDANRRCELLTLKGKLAAAAGKPEAAADVYRSVVLVNGAPYQRVGEALKQLGELQERQLKQPQQALESYGRIVTWPGMDANRVADARRRISGVHRKLKQHDQALAALEAVLTIEKVHVNHKYEALKRIAEIQERDLKKPNAAMDTLRKAIQLPNLHDHRKADLYWRLAHVYLSMKQTDKARKALQALLALKSLRPNQKQDAVKKLAELTE